MRWIAALRTAQKNSRRGAFYMRPQGVCRLTGGYRIRPYGVNRKKCLTILILCAKIFQQSFRWLLRPDRMPGAGSRNSEIVMSTYIEYGSFYHDRERGEITMKQGIHPNYVDCTITCACGNVIHTRDTKPEIHVEVCSKCHPFYTGKQKLVDTGGRVERFKRRFAKSGK